MKGKYKRKEGLKGLEGRENKGCKKNNNGIMRKFTLRRCFCYVGNLREDSVYKTCCGSIPNPQMVAHLKEVSSECYFLITAEASGSGVTVPP